MVSMNDLKTAIYKVLEKYNGKDIYSLSDGRFCDQTIVDLYQITNNEVSANLLADIKIECLFANPNNKEQLLPTPSYIVTVEIDVNKLYNNPPNFNYLEEVITQKLGEYLAIIPKDDLGMALYNFDDE